jgi:hypothetical protein
MMWLLEGCLVQCFAHAAVMLLLLHPGFVESFNISVAAALIMYEAQQQRIRKLGQAGDLTAQQQEQLLAAFLLRGVVSALCCLSSSWQQ